MEAKMEDGFLPHDTDKRPVSDDQAAFAILRSGEKVLVPPRNETNEHGAGDNLWFRLGEDDDEENDDVVAFKPVEMSEADRIIWDVRKFLVALDADANDPLREHPISKRTMEERKSQLLHRVTQYLEEWPHDLNLKRARRIDRWLEPDDPGDDEDFEYDEY